MYADAQGTNRPNEFLSGTLLQLQFDVSRDGRVVTRPTRANSDSHLPFSGHSSSAAGVTVCNRVANPTPYKPSPPLHASPHPPNDTHECQGCLSGVQVSVPVPFAFSPTQVDLRAVPEPRKW